jgi:hypothetical protein
MASMRGKLIGVSVKPFTAPKRGRLIAPEKCTKRISALFFPLFLNKKRYSTWQRLINSYTQVVPTGDPVHPSPDTSGLQ